MFFFQSHHFYSESEPVLSADGAQAQIATATTGEKTDRAEPKTNSNDEYEREYQNCIKSFKHDQGTNRYVRCEICFKFPEIVRRGCNNNRNPAITLESGTRFRRQTVVDHFASSYHKECKRAHSLKSTDVGEKIARNR